MSDSATERKLYKDWFDRDAARRLASQVELAWPAFDRKTFVRKACKQLSALEFHDRVRQFSDALRETLPEDIPQALQILTDSLPPVLPDCDAVTDGWLQWPVGQFIADHGVEHLPESMQAMVALTQRFSSEFAVRPFVERYPDAVFDRLMKLTAHPSPHVRRWCSEGVRSRLPWGKRLDFLCENPQPVWPILDALRGDEELYVRRSVANNLNDIAKDHPELVIERCKRWSRSGDDKVDWVIRHGLRSLIKQGHPQALAAMGYRKPSRLDASLKIKPRRIDIGESLELSADIVSAASRRQKLMIDLVVHYQRKANKTSEKVFKWTTLTLAGGDQRRISKKLPFRQTTVRALYPGRHRIELQINGHRLASGSFTLG